MLEAIIELPKIFYMNVCTCVCVWFLNNETLNIGVHVRYSEFLTGISEKYLMSFNEQEDNLNMTKTENGNCRSRKHELPITPTKFVCSSFTVPKDKVPLHL